jgi:hypothetical protein
MSKPVEGVDDGQKQFGVRGFSNSFHGVLGSSESGTGVFGGSTSGTGVSGRSNTSTGVYGESTSNNAPSVYGYNSNGVGILGKGNIAGRFEGSKTGVHGVSPTSVGVEGETNTEGYGVYGHSNGGYGVFGKSSDHVGVDGNGKIAGVFGDSSTGHGVWGKSESRSGVYAQSNSPTDYALYAGSASGLAAWLDGNVEVTGDIRLLGADCAEEFDTSGADKVEPGTVMVLSSSEGALEVSSKAYDKRVVGVASGAGGFKPGIVLDKKQLQEESNENRRRMPIALMGKVYVKVDADYSPIEVGDLLTTSPTEGHAMKASDPIKSFGSVIGKALGSIKDGLGMIPVLVALQ